MITVRKLVSDDFMNWWVLRKHALELHPDAFGSTSTDPWVVDEAIARSRFNDISIEGDNAIVGAFETGGKLIGNVGIRRETGRKETHRAGIWGVYVDPAARGQRVGAQLLDATIGYARTIAGILQLELTVACHNAPAFALYERSGFHVFGRHPRGLMLNGNPVDEFLMVLLLDAPASDVGFRLDGEMHDHRDQTNT